MVRHLKVEIRKNNFLQKVVVYGNEEVLENEPLLNEEIDNWFIGSSVTDGEIVIDLKDTTEDFYIPDDDDLPF